jgi:penicillin amidase
MPKAVDLSRGWIATANNRVAADDFPYPLSGTWSSGYRALRIRQMLEGKPKFRRDDFARMQQDAVSLRAVDCVPRLLSVLAPANDQRLRHAAEHLAVWDCRMEPDRVAASIFDVFFTKWSERVAAERFSGETASLVAGAIGGLAAELLADDRAGWFREKESRQPAIRQSFEGALDFLSGKFGSDMLDWGWGRVHSLQQKHILSGRGELAQLLDLGGMPVRGNSVTVCNTGLAPDYSATMGAGYRMIADLSDPHGGLWAVDAGSESGHPASPHYNDQIGEWLTAQYHYVPLDPEQLRTNADRELTLVPGG